MFIFIKQFYFYKIFIELKQKKNNKIFISKINKFNK